MIFSRTQANTTSTVGILLTSPTHGDTCYPKVGRVMMMMIMMLMLMVMVMMMMMMVMLRTQTLV